MQTNTKTEIGIFSVIFLVTGNMLGSGIYMLPATLAKLGGIALIGWLITLIGIIAFALVIAKLSVLLPNGAGPYSYVKQAFGNYMGYQTNLIYSIANWVALVSMPTIVVGYAQNFFPQINHPLASALVQIAIIWLFTIINIHGAKMVTKVQSFGFLLALIPILIVAVGGWFWFNPQIFWAGFNVTHSNPVNVVNNSFNTIMWAFIGVESACVSARLVKNPKRNVPIATILGVILAALIYISTCTVMLGIIPAQTLSHSSAPFADVLGVIFHSPKAGIIISVIAIIDCLGAMAGWFLVTGQSAQAAATENLFPKVFAKVNAKGMPSNGLIILSIFMSLVVIATISPTAQEQFNKIISMSVLLYLFPYLYTTMSILITGKTHKIPRIYYVLGLVASMFLVWSILLTDVALIKYAVVIIVLSIPLYKINQSKKHRIHGL